MTSPSVAAPGPRPGLPAVPVQLLVIVVVSGVAVITTSPRSVLVLGLIALNIALLAASRLSPEQWRGQAAFLCGAMVAAAALIAVSTHGYPAMFGLFVAGSAGYRLPRAQAVTVALVGEVLCTGVVLTGIGPDHADMPWWSQVPVGVTVLAGMLNRERTQALQAANQALVQASRAAESEARESVLAERGRIARDVHDVLAHSLAAIAMQLELADTLLDIGQVEQAQQATRKAQAIARQGMEQTQRTVFALREGVLPLTATLRSLAADVGAGFTAEGTDRDVPADVAQALVRVVQESLTNASKHAAGAPVAVTLTYEVGVRVVVVNGPGRSSGTGSGMGLVGMRERMAGLHGTLRSGPSEGGWRVCAEVPA